MADSDLTFGVRIDTSDLPPQLGSVSTMVGQSLTSGIQSGQQMMQTIGGAGTQIIQDLGRAFSGAHMLPSPPAGVNAMMPGYGGPGPLSAQGYGVGQLAMGAIGFGAPPTAFQGEFQRQARGELRERFMGQIEQIGITTASYGAGQAIGAGIGMAWGAAGGAAAGPVGFIAGAGLGYLFDTVGMEMYERGSERKFRNFLKAAGGAMTGGKALSEGQREAWAEAAFDVSGGWFGESNWKEFQGTLGEAIGAGMFTGTRDVETFKENAKKLRENVESLQKILKAEQSEIIQMMGALNNTGMTDMSTQGAMLGASGALASRYGLSRTAVAQGMVQSTMMYQQAGFAPEMGAQNFLLTQDAIRGGINSGLVSQRDIKMAGGAGSLSQTMQQETMSWMRGPIGRYLAYGLGAGGASARMDPNLAARWVTGDVTEQEIAQGAYRAMSQPDALLNYMNFEMSPGQHFMGLSAVDLDTGRINMATRDLQRMMPSFRQLETDIETARSEGRMGDVEALKFRREGAIAFQLQQKFGMGGTPREIRNRIRISSREGREEILKNMDFQFMSERQFVNDVTDPKFWGRAWHITKNLRSTTPIGNDPEDWEIRRRAALDNAGAVEVGRGMIMLGAGELTGLEKSALMMDVIAGGGGETSGEAFGAAANERINMVNRIDALAARWDVGERGNVTTASALMTDKKFMGHLRGGDMKAAEKILAQKYGKTMGEETAGLTRDIARYRGNIEGIQERIQKSGRYALAMDEFRGLLTVGEGADKERLLGDETYETNEGRLSDAGLRKLVSSIANIDTSKLDNIVSAQRREMIESAVEIARTINPGAELVDENGKPTSAKNKINQVLGMIMESKNVQYTSEELTLRATNLLNNAAKQIESNAKLIAGIKK